MQCSCAFYNKVTKWSNIETSVGYSICTLVQYRVAESVIRHVCVFMFLCVSVRLEAVQQLTVETQSEGSVRVRWRGVSGVRAYRLVWGPFTGQDEANIKQHLAFLAVFIFFNKFPYTHCIFVSLLTKVEMWRVWRSLATASSTLCPACSLTQSTSSPSSRCMRATLRAL